MFKPSWLIAAGAFGAMALLLGRVSHSRTAAGDTVFAEDFESGTLDAWADGVDPLRQSVVDAPERAEQGSKYLRVTYPRGHDGGWLTRFLAPGYDSLFVSFHVRFPPDWRGGTKLVALYGSRTDDRWSALGKAGTCPTGTDFFATMIVTAATDAALRFYTYYPAMAREPDGQTCWGRFGDSSATYVAPLTVSPGVWHHIEFWVRLNRPDQADGSQSFWVDGVQRGSWSGLRFRTSDVLRLNAVQLTFSVSGGVAQTQALDVDNIVVSTRRPPS